MFFVNSLTVIVKILQKNSYDYSEDFLIISGAEKIPS